MPTSRALSVVPLCAKCAALTIDVSSAVNPLPSAIAARTISVVGIRVGNRCSRRQLNDLANSRASLIGVNPLSKRSGWPPSPVIDPDDEAEPESTDWTAPASGSTEPAFMACSASAANLLARALRLSRLPIRFDLFPQCPAFPVCAGRSRLYFGSTLLFKRRLFPQMAVDQFKRLVRKLPGQTCAGESDLIQNRPQGVALFLRMFPPVLRIRSKLRTRNPP